MLPVMAIYVNPWWLAFTVIVIIAVLAIVVFLVIRSYERKVTTGQEDLVGKSAVVKTELHPKGEVFVEDELWSAEIDKGMAAPEEEVTITRVHGLKLYVTKK
jgi:membrane-bound serine protease (ClpP class)